LAGAVQSGQSVPC